MSIVNDNMSDTLETDAEAWIETDRANAVVFAKFARKLERERDEARERIEKQKLEIVRLNGATNHAGGTPLKIALRERDEWAAMCGQYKQERDEAITRRMETIMQCELYEQERDEARENCKSIVDKANELIARWDQPSWKDTAPTAGFINALRIAVEAYEKKKP
jgi:hypothetical protein